MKTWTQETVLTNGLTIRETAAAAKKALGNRYAGTFVRGYSGRYQVEVMRVKHGYHGVEHVRHACYPL